MVRLATDEDFDNDILRGLLRLEPELDIWRMQDAGLVGADDPTVLEWAAQEGRILLTHDVNTMTKHAYDHVKAGQPMPGLLVVRRNSAFGPVIEDLMLLIAASQVGEWESQVQYIPL